MRPNHQRRRSTGLLGVVLVAQLLLLGFQVKTQSDVQLIRVWALGLVTPFARLTHWIHHVLTQSWDNYVWLVGARKENERLQRELTQLRLEVQRLRQELARAERAQALAMFRKLYPGQLIAARVIGRGPMHSSHVILIDRGTRDGLQRGMAVMTPAGLVGRVVACYSTAAQVLLITDANFAAGVVSQKHNVTGTLKGTGGVNCRVDYVQMEQVVEPGEWFYTSGDDRLLPRGLPVGPVSSVRDGPLLKEIRLEPMGLKGALEEVLVVLEPAHLPPGELPSIDTPKLLKPPASAEPTGDSARSIPAMTDADRLMEWYRYVGAAQGHVFGQGLPGSPPPDFNLAGMSPPGEWRRQPSRHPSFSQR